MSKLILIDGNAILHRAFHALPPLTNKKGEPINAVYGLVSMLLRVVVDLKPTHIAVAFDEKAPTFRQKEFPAYQAQRPPTAPELESQFAKAKAFFEAAKIPVYSKPGFEADDVIGTIASLATEHRSLITSTVIVTGDRDQLQLVDDKLNIKLYMPVAGLTNAKLFGEAEVKEKMGVSPAQIPDLKSLMGDASDNYPGVPGIGPKTAASLLAKYGSLENIYRNLDKITPALAKKLKAGEELGRQGKKLAIIVRDVPLEVNFAKMADWDLDSEKVIALFQEFGFKTLTERIKKVGRKIDQQKQMPLL